MTQAHKVVRQSWRSTGRAVCDDCDWNASASCDSDSPHVHRRRTKQSAWLYSLATRHVSRTGHAVAVLREYRSVFIRANQA